jgi:hypothetical protein
LVILMILTKLRLTLGVLFASFLFLPWGVYHSLMEPYIVNYLYGYKLPFGYVSFIFGLLLVLYSKIKLNKVVRMDSLLIIGGFATLLPLTPPSEYFISLWHKVSYTAWDIESSSFLILPFLLALLCMAMGLISHFHRMKKSKHST